jgi:hypothetical protein
MPSRAHSPTPMSLSNLHEAVDLYLSRAYPEGDLAAPVRRRLEWREDLDFASMLGEAPFEKTASPNAPGGVIYGLRVGNDRYPHMKMQIQAWPGSAGFLLSINTHDEALAAVTDPESFEQSRALREYNARLKQEIEDDWEGAGLPTFGQYLRDYLQAAGVSDWSGARSSLGQTLC